MTEREISSLRHPLIKQYIRLSGSRRHRLLAGRLPLEGPNLIREALRAGIVPQAVFYTRRCAERPGLRNIFSNMPGEVERLVLAPELFKKMALTDTPQEIAALVPLPAILSARPRAGEISLGLLLDRIRDPGNLGTIIRTAAAAGAGGIWLTSGTADPFSPKVMRSTAGAVFHLPPVFIPDPLEWLDAQKEKGVQIVAAAPDQGRYYGDADLRPPTIFIIGNESCGVDPGLAAGADQKVSIPQPGWGSSLNAAVSTAILLYEALRQRR